VLNDGQKAVDFLFGEWNYENDQAQSLLVLLDLNLPVYDGFEILKRLKNHAKTRCIPVIILTTTDNPDEIARCYELGCNVYISKPVEYAQFAQAIRNLGLFLSIVKTPSA
jgi:CheY-like chemotaxis protein